MASDKNKTNKNSDYNDNYIYSNSDHSVNNLQRRSKKVRNKKIIFSILIVVSVIIGLIGGMFIYAYNMLDTLNYKPMQTEDGEAEYVEGTAQDPMILNVALFGVDSHAKADVKSRSDTILILSLDSRRKKIKLTSIMRDLWMHIPGYKDNRINTAIALGGEQLAIKTIEQNFGIKIDRYCTVDFAGFKDIIDIIGGLDIEITKQEAHHINRLLIELDAALSEGGLTPFKSPLIEEVDGVHHLNGAQSLQYARSRKVPTAEGHHDDYARTFRQRRVISLVIDKLKTSSLPQLLSVIEKAGPYINTNLKKNEIITLGKNSLKYLQYEISEFRLPEDGNYEGANMNGASVLVIKDMSKARYDLAKFIYEDSVKGTQPETKGEKSSGSGQQTSSQSNSKEKTTSTSQKSPSKTNSESKTSSNNQQVSSKASSSPKTAGNKSQNSSQPNATKQSTAASKQGSAQQNAKSTNNTQTSKASQTKSKTSNSESTSATETKSKSKK